MKLTTTVLAAGLAALFAPACAAAAADKVTLGTNWFAEPEQGGYYQAVADGTFAKFGLDVTILPGGPQNNNSQLLRAGKIEFRVGGNMLEAFDAVDQGIPIVVVAGHFQKDPVMFMSHPGAGLDNWADLPKATAIVGATGIASFYEWMRVAHGFKSENVKPYNFNSAMFIADKGSIQQGYVTSEPFTVEKEGGFKPNIFLLADHGYATYATTIESRTDIVVKSPDLVQRFADASAIGWYHYLYGDNAAANAAIKQANPDMTDDQIAFSIAKLKEFGVVDSGDALKMGIGAMTDQKVADFFAQMVKAKVVKPDLDYKKAYTLQFVNKGVGLELHPK